MLLPSLRELERRAEEITNTLPNRYRATVDKSFVKIPSAPARIIIEKIGFLGLFNRQIAQLTVGENGKFKAHFFDPISTLIAICAK